MVNFFSGEDVVQSETIMMNKEKSIKIEPQINDIRVALRIKGKGTFRIDTITVNDTSLWNSNTDATSPFHLIKNTNWYYPNHKKVKL